jgi:hypothetical protein
MVNRCYSPPKHSKCELFSHLFLPKSFDNNCRVINGILCYRYPTPEPDPLLQNVSWKPISKSNFPYLSIDTNLKVRYSLNNGHAAWWVKLYNKYIPDASTCWPFHPSHSLIAEGSEPDLPRHAKASTQTHTT